MRIQTKDYESVPSDVHLVLLCLDYLLDLRRKNNPDILNTQKHLDADYISLAAFALMHSVRRPEYLVNKCVEDKIHPSIFAEIDDMILASGHTFPRPYDAEYNDLQHSNLYRFFGLEGLAGGTESGDRKSTRLNSSHLA